MITLIGTGHVFNLKNALLDIFETKKPEVICVELDQRRYHALKLKQTDPEQYKQNSQQLPAIYKLLARFQENMADEYGVTPGEEMLTAITYAQEHQLPVELIDMDAQQLFTEMLKKMSFTERMRLFLTGLGGFFINKKKVEKELQSIQNNFDTYLDDIGKKFPTIKKTLIDDRNDYMVQQLINLSTTYSNIVALIGDGHVPGITKIFDEKNVSYETIRLSDLRSIKSESMDSSQAHFSINYHSS